MIVRQLGFIRQLYFNIPLHIKLSFLLFHIRIEKTLDDSKKVW